MKLKVKKSAKPSAESPSRSSDLIGGSSVKYNKFPAIGRPSFTDKIRFPDEITELSDYNVSDLLGKYTLLWSYVNQDFARLKVRKLWLEQQEARRANEYLRTNPRLNHVEKWKRDALLKEDTIMEELQQQLTNVNAELEYTAMYLANYDRYITALSRELSRKMNERQLPGNRA
jgi:hypothetical protein